MVRKICFGFVWFLILILGTLILGGGVVGAIAGVNDPANSFAAGQAAGQAFGQAYGGMIFLASLIIAVIGSIFGWLPGTKSKNI
jgi:hypothetical protein